MYKTLLLTQSAIRRVKRGQYVALSSRQNHAIRAPILVLPPVKPRRGRVKVGKRDASKRLVPVRYAGLI